MKNISSCHCGNTENSFVTVHIEYSHSEKAKGDYTSFPELCNIYRTFKQKDSMLNTSAITAGTKSSMKP